jgi:acetyl-CoA carboxylase carboxyltransferase component
MGGHSVGIVASQPLVWAGVITVAAAEKAARFIRFCDAFNIPIISLVDTPAYMIGEEEECAGMIYRGAKLIHAYAEATVPQIVVLIRKAYAGAYVAMGSKYLGADLVYAWPIAEIVSVGPDTAASVIFRKQIEKADDPEKVRKELIEKYRKEFCNPYHAGSIQHIDDIIEPEKTRQFLAEGLEVLKNKKISRPAKKHGNIPL